MTAPLRFLAGIVACWTCLRAAAILPWPAWQEPVLRPAFARPAPSPTSSSPPAAALATVAAAPLRRESPSKPAQREMRAPALVVSRLAPSALSVPSAPSLPAQFVRPSAAEAPSPPPLHFALAPPRPSPSRWSASAWAHARGGGGGSLAAGGSLGGSQAGVRLGYRLNRSADAPVTLIARLYTPATPAAAAEAAVGIEWKPHPRLPMRIAAERRQALSHEGRSAFSLMAHGGVSEVAVGGSFRLQAYAQAGIVGTGSRDLFADGAARVTRRLGSERVSIGAGAWGAAQPGVSRVDVGPTMIVAVPGARATVALDWRVPVAGAAKPRSGPALTLSTGF